MNKHRKIDKDELMRLANEYVDECIDNQAKKTASYKIVDLPERMIPTVGYFVDHWLRRKHFDFYCRQRWYDVMSDKSHPLHDTIKDIDKMFKSLGENIVANEGKGIFWAKNALGMSDENIKDQEIKVTIVKNLDS